MIVVATLGVALIALAFRVRAGRSHTFYSIYRTDAPPWLRNRVFSLLPGGIALIAGTATVGFAEADIDAATVALMLITWAALILALIWLFHPPEFMKPRWLREVESGAAPEAVGRGDARRIYLPPPVYWAMWAATGTFFVLWLAFHWSLSWLIGLGFAISTLMASTPRKNRVPR